VAVFGAGNFPLAFSVAGGDTASALAAGCPVVVKVHPAHAGTSALVGEAIDAAARACAMPAGVFTLLFGEGNAVGEALVQHPAIQAVGFTGSRRGGLALTALAQVRPMPIPVYAEMSSINPVLVYPGALAERAESLAKDYVASLTLGVGQFCTNPGLLLLPVSADGDRFLAAAAEAIAAVPAQPMTAASLCTHHASGVARMTAQAAVRTVATGPSAEGASRATLLETDARSFLGTPALQAELFGPAGLVVRCQGVADFRAILEALEGQLTIALQIAPADYADAAALLPLLETRAGRILVNGFGTGVEVAHAMVHGGPYPATTDTRSTSVGTRAIDRFLRPVCYQNLPAELLPPLLREGGAPGFPCLVDGTLQT
jgi:NADP-dependent aldehyde dehydrogenase